MILDHLDLKSMLYTKLAERGITNVYVTWNDDRLMQIDTLPQPEKNAALDITADEFKKMFEEVEEGYLEVTMIDESLTQVASSVTQIEVLPLKEAFDQNLALIEKEAKLQREIDRLSAKIIAKLPHMTNTNNPVDFPKVIK